MYVTSISHMDEISYHGNIAIALISHTSAYHHQKFYLEDANAAQGYKYAVSARCNNMLSRKEAPLALSSPRTYIFYNK